MYRIIIAFVLFATVSHALPITTTRLATEGYVTNKVAVHNTNLTAHATLLAGYVATNNATYTATVARAGTALQPAVTNGWTVESHSGLVPYTGASSTVDIGVNLFKSDRCIIGNTIDDGTSALQVEGNNGIRITGVNPYGQINAYSDPFGLPLLLQDLTPSPVIIGSMPEDFTNKLQVAGNAGVFGNMTVTGTVSAPSFNGSGASLTDITPAQVGTMTGEEITNLVAQASSTAFTVNLTSNKLTTFTFAPTNATYNGLCEGSPQAQATVSVPIGTNGNYAFAWGCTNTTFTTVEGAFVTGEFFCSENEAGDMTAKVEIYRRDIATDTMSEWGDGGSTFTVPAGAAPSSVPFKVWVPDYSTTNSFRIWARIKRVGGSATSARLLIVGSGVGYATHFSLGVPSSIAIDAHDADAAAHASLFAAKEGTNRAPFMTYSGLTGSVMLTNNLEAPISISGTGAVSVAFSGLVSPYPVYLTAQGFSSLTFPGNSYLVGGGVWQTNRVNHFIVWQYGTNLYINPLVTTEE